MTPNYIRKKIESLIRGRILRQPLDNSYFLDRMIPVGQPKKPKAQIIITALTEDGLRADGKSSGNTFFPTFCATIRKQQIATTYCQNIRELLHALKRNLPNVIIHVYGEDHKRIDTPETLEAEKKAAFVFNAAAIGPIIADKEKSRTRLTNNGVLMPEVDIGSGQSIVFSNNKFGTSEETNLIQPGQPINPDRYNTRFIDTIVTFEEKRYFTTVRLACVSNKILHAYVRARNIQENNPSVHAYNTPLDFELLAQLQTQLVDPYREEFKEIADRIFRALGPGFYAHDLMIEAKTKKIYVCETGLKFDDPAFWMHAMPIANHLPFHQPLFPPENFAALSARTLISDCQDHHLF